LSRHPDRVVAPLREGALVEDEDAIRGAQAWCEVRLEGGEHGFVRPGGLGKEPLQRARCRAVDRLGHMLGIAPVGVLHQQAAQILRAARPRLLPSEEWREMGLEGREGGGDIGKRGGIHGAIPHVSGRNSCHRV